MMIGKKGKTYPLCTGCKPTLVEEPHACTHFLSAFPPVRCKCPQCRREEALRVKFDMIVKDTPDLTWGEFMDHVDGKVALEERAERKGLLQRETETMVMHYQTVHGHGLKIRFFFLRDEENRPVITIAIGKVEEGYYYRGISICHPKDNPSRRVGKIHALKRLNAALQGHNLERRLSEEVSAMLIYDLTDAAEKYLEQAKVVVEDTEEDDCDPDPVKFKVATTKIEPIPQEMRLFQKPKCELCGSTMAQGRCINRSCPNAKDDGASAIAEDAT